MRLCWGFRVLGLSGLEARVSVCTFSGRDGFRDVRLLGFRGKGMLPPSQVQFGEETKQTLAPHRR